MALFVIGKFRPKKQYDMKNKKCYNCKHAGKKFKIAGKTHLHCCNPVKYPKFEEVEIASKVSETAWETLRAFSDSCDLHEIDKTQEVDKCETPKPNISKYPWNVGFGSKYSNPG